MKTVFGQNVFRHGVVSVGGAMATCALLVACGGGGGSGTDTVSTPVTTFSPAIVGLAFDPITQVLTVADVGGSVIRSVSVSTGATGIAAGSLYLTGSTDATASGARFNAPYGVARIGTDTYVADGSNNTIRKMSSAGVVTTLAGAPLAVGSADGTGVAAGFYGPRGITTDGTDLYVADTGNQTVRKVTQGGVVTTVAGAVGLAGSANGIPGSAARFNNPFNLAVDQGFIYVTDTLNNSLRKIVLATGAVSTVAGSNTSAAGSANGASGSASSFNSPAGIAVVGGFGYVIDSGNALVRKVDLLTGATTTLAGQVGVTGLTDGMGAAAQFNKPYGVVSDGAGSLYVADGGNLKIRKIVLATGAVTTLSTTF